MQFEIQSTYANIHLAMQHAKYIRNGKET